MAQVPTSDGQLNLFNLHNSQENLPRVYFVNGIRVLAREHAVAAANLSLLIERPVWGVYNGTAGLISGFVFDTVQCVLDYTQNASARLSSRHNLNKPPTVSETEIPQFLSKVSKNALVWNQATLTLFKQLVEHRHEEKLIVAHSQGNLITSNALFVLEDVLGSAALQKVRVYSLASPAPAWPLGLRKNLGGGGRQENAYMNDLVALLRPHNLAKKIGVDRFQNAGDFRTLAGAARVGLAPHDMQKIVATLNFLQSIRNDLGITAPITPQFLQDCAKQAEQAIPDGGGGLLKWMKDMFVG